jgi:hypothetical protein
MQAARARAPTEIDKIRLNLIVFSMPEVCLDSKWILCKLLQRAAVFTCRGAIHEVAFHAPNLMIFEHVLCGNDD